MEARLRPGPRVASGLALLVAGGLAVLTLLGFMNRTTQAKPEAPAERVASFTVERRPPKRDQRPRPQRRRRAPSARPRSAVPAAPRVGNAVGALSLGLDTGGLVDLDDVDRSLLGDTSDVAMTGNTVDTPPVPIDRVAPDYPVRLRKKGVTGQVVLNLLVDTDGSVARVRVLSSDPPGVFDELAVSAAKRWRFRPGSNQGKPYAVWVNQPFDFRLD